MNQTITKAGYIVFLGKPNVGKSTLLNTLLDQKLAITTPKPQTTRNQILAILNKNQTQYIFMDTPGWLQKTYKSKLNSAMMQQTKEALKNVDVIVTIIDGSKGLRNEDLFILKIVKSMSKPTVLLVNKTDLVSNKNKLLPLFKELSLIAPDSQIIPVSALNNENTDILLSNLKNLLPSSSEIFPKDQLTVHSTNFFISEFIREKVLFNIHQEIPYQIAIVVDELIEKRDIVVIKARIIVNQDSHRPILLGKKGATIKKIGEQSREEIEKFLGKKVYLELTVAKDSSWLNKEYKIKEYNHMEQLF